MKIFLTGATGFLGHHLLPKLVAAGHDCLALTRYKPGCRDLQVLPRVTVRQADAFDDEALRASMQGADAVINMVGILNEKGRKGRGFHHVHVELVEKLIAAARDTGVRRFVQVSALGAGEGRSHYQISKGEAEQRIQAAEDLDWTIFRPSVVFGAGDSFFNRFATLLRLAPLLPLACPDARLQPVWADDVAAAIAQVLDDDATYGRIYPLVGPKEYTLRELVRFTATTAGLRRGIVGLPDWLARLQAAVMDFVPGKPFSTDNYRSLQTPNTSEENGLVELGIRPRSVESVVPTYLCARSPRQTRLDACRRHFVG
ncbi:MAG: complex I NDUFA9 subunit family protein [Xanthomonadales bacterium]